MRFCKGMGRRETGRMDFAREPFDSSGEPDRPCRGDLPVQLGIPCKWTEGKRNLGHHG
jgi:hypothetical protein